MSTTLNVSTFKFTLKPRGSALYIPELRLSFDNATDCDGLGELGGPTIYFLSHLHAAQCFFLPQQLIQNHEKAKIYVPLPNKLSLTNFVQASYPNSIKVEHDFYGVKTNETVKIKDNLSCKVYEVPHKDGSGIPCYAYGLTVNKSVLKKEYIGINRHEVIQLKRSGVQLTENIQETVMIYLSHVDLSAFDNKEIFTYPYIIISGGDCQDDIILSHPQNKFVLLA